MTYFDYALLIVFCFPLPLLTAFILRNKSKNVVIKVGIVTPVLIITLLLIAARPGSLYMVEIIYFLWGTVFLVVTYIAWLIINLVRRIR
ncbi:hypothetical protein CWE12_10655 [Aliidiomarina sedimenti]|uniref:DUF2651 domain-containing protein n=1 Tax=Aliidiomarina sedimenti TaxID=1933879 RepID=A0ABY0BX78_9GAMM|nr:hypothetical protein CWE12_10655 [Aliidiomarina sedimenti]